MREAHYTLYAGADFSERKLLHGNDQYIIISLCNGSRLDVTTADNDLINVKIEVALNPFYCQY